MPDLPDRDRQHGVAAPRRMTGHAVPVAVEAIGRLDPEAQRLAADIRADLAALTEAVRALGALAQQPTSLSSVEFETGAKGDIRATVKAYSADIAEALRQAQEVYLEAQTFARTNGAQP